MESSQIPTLHSNIQKVRHRIAEAARGCGRDPESVHLVAVSKTVSADKVAQAASAGLKCFGENYVQEALDKMEALSHLPVSWHFIGHLQTNKVRYVVGRFALIHSVDSVKLADAIERRCALVGVTQEILVQVNLGGEKTKSGIDVEGSGDLLRQIDRMPHLRLRGLMTLPPFFDEPEKARPYFAALRTLRDRLAGQGFARGGLDQLSMGMTGDFEAAIEEGATMVRIGTAIFGKRP